MWYWYLFTFSIGGFLGFVMLALLASGNRADQDMEILRLRGILKKHAIDPGPGYTE